MLQKVVLGALPFYSTLDQLKELVSLHSVDDNTKQSVLLLRFLFEVQGVTAVVTLNEEFEVFITPEQYQAIFY